MSSTCWVNAKWVPHVAEAQSQGPTWEQLPKIVTAIICLGWARCVLGHLICSSRDIRLVVAGIPTCSRVLVRMASHLLILVMKYQSNFLEKTKTMNKVEKSMIFSPLVMIRWTSFLIRISRQEMRSKILPCNFLPQSLIKVVDCATRAAPHLLSIAGSLPMKWGSAIGEEMVTKEQVRSKSPTEQLSSFVDSWMISS